MQLGFRVSRESIWHCGANCCRGTLFRVASLSSTQCLLLHIIHHAYNVGYYVGYRTEHSLLSTSQTPTKDCIFRHRRKNQTLEFISYNHKTRQDNTPITKLSQTTNNNGQSSCTLQQHGRRCPLP